MKTLCIVPCGSRKIWDKNPFAGPTPAKDVYIGSFAKKCQEYARTFYSDSYVILSARYGFLWPDDIIPSNYNVTFNDLSTRPITIPEMKKSAVTKKLLDYDQIVVIAGRNYFEMAKQVFPGKIVRNPLKGCSGNGVMEHRMALAIESNTPL